MDYLDSVAITRHSSWAAFEEWRQQAGAALTLCTTRGDAAYLDHDYRTPQVLLFGRESAGVPTPVFEAANSRLYIPMQQGFRSLNVAMACAMVVGEALRQHRASSGAEGSDGAK